MENEIEAIYFFNSLDTYINKNGEFCKIFLQKL